MPKPALALKVQGFVARHRILVGAAVLLTIASIALEPLRSWRAASLLVDRGTKLLAQGDNKAALAVFDKALSVNHSFADGYLYRAKTYALQATGKKPWMITSLCSSFTETGKP